MQFEQFVSKEDLPSDFSQLDETFTPLTQPLEPLQPQFDEIPHKLNGEAASGGNESGSEI